VDARPGWYVQPDRSERYWDGHAWTPQTKPVQPVPGPAGPADFPTYPYALTPTPPPPPPPPAPDPGKRPFYKRKSVIAGAVAVVLFLALTAPLGRSRGEELTDPAPVPTVTATVTVAPSSEPTAEPSPEPPTQPVQPAPEVSASPAEQPPEIEPSPVPPEPEPEPETFKLPNLVGENLQYAQDELQALGSWVLDQQDASGLGRYQVRDSNWKVCTQKPAAGKVVPVDTLVVLGAVKLDERCP